MLIDKTVQKLIFIVSGIVIFYSQIMLWQNYLVEKIGERPELNFMDAQYHLQRGIDSAYEGEFQKAIKLDPTNPDTHYKLANYYISYFGETKSKQALEEYKTAMLFSGKDFQAEILEDLYKNKNWDYLRLEVIVPNTDYARYYFAEFLRDKKLYNESIKEFKKAVILSVKNDNNHIKVNSLNYIGIIYLWKNKPYVAVDYFKSAIRVDPKNAWLVNNLGQSYMRMNQFEQAKEIFEKSIRIKPTMGITYFYLGVVYEELGSKRTAHDYYLKSLKYKSDSYTETQVKNRLKQMGY